MHSSKSASNDPVDRLPKLRPHQRALAVPGTFACSDYPNKRFSSLEESTDKAIQDVSGFYAWAKAEPKLAGLIPWHFANRSAPQVNTSAPSYSGCDLRPGAIAMPRLMAELRKIGKEILAHNGTGRLARLKLDEEVARRRAFAVGFGTAPASIAAQPTLAAVANARPLKSDEGSAAPKRSISWWWDCYHGGTVDGLLDFCKAHTNIVTRVLMICEVFTCVSASWSNASAPPGTCINNGGIGGTVTGTLSDKCKQAIPALNQLGIETELWLGEDDSISSARYQVGPSFLITPIFHDFSDFFPFSPGLLAVFPGFLASRR